MDGRVIDKFIKQLELMKLEYAGKCVGGAPQTLEGYRELVGVHKGLQLALDTFNNIFGEKDDDSGEPGDSGGGGPGRYLGRG